MIAKHVPMRSVGKSDFAGLVRYITDAQSKDHRLGHVQVTNCDAYSVRDTITEVLATQYANTRAESDKTYHLIVSFRAGEQPSADTLRQVVHRVPRRFLFIRWGTKALRQEIVSSNPHTRIIYSDYVKFER